MGGCCTLRRMARGKGKGFDLAFNPGAELFYGRTIRPADRVSEMAMRVRIEELRLERQRLIDEAKEKDRELARYRLEDRRRERAEAERLKEEEDLKRQMDADLERTRGHLAINGPPPVVVVEPKPEPISEQDSKIAEELKRVLAGTWKPPT